MRDAAAVIVAGGKGLRFGGTVRKQYLKLLGKPLLWWSLSAFEKSPSFGAILLVLPVDDVDSVRKQARRWGFKKLSHITAGGATREDSVYAGVAQVPASFRWIAVHDGVRPLVTPKIIELTLKEARRFKGAIAAVPSKDTVKLADDKQCIRDTPARSHVWLAQTPQIFASQLLRDAFNQKDYASATDDAQLVERTGVSVKLVHAGDENLKVTVPADFIAATAILKRRSKETK